MDKFDQLIIQHLSEDARQSNAEVARKIGLSRTAVAGRLKRLEDKGIVSGYKIELRNPGKQVAAYFQMNFSHLDYDKLLPLISQIEEIKDCRSITGDIDLIIYAEADTMEQLDTVRIRLSELPKISYIVTHPVLKDLKSCS